MMEVRLNNEDDKLKMEFFVNNCLVMKKEVVENFVDSFLSYFNLDKIKIINNANLELSKSKKRKPITIIKVDKACYEKGWTIYMSLEGINIGFSNGTVYYELNEILEDINKIKEYFVNPLVAELRIRKPKTCSICGDKFEGEYVKCSECGRWMCKHCRRQDICVDCDTKNS